MTLRDTEKDPRKRIDILINPTKHGYQECEDCNGYGGTLRNSDIQLQEICGECGGDGVVPIPENDDNDGTTCSILEEMGVTPVLDESGFSSGVGIVEKK